MSITYMEQMTKLQRKLQGDQKSIQKEDRKEKFIEKFNEKMEQSSAVDEKKEKEVWRITTLQKQEMSMEEYKAYIYNEISKIPIHPSRMHDHIAVQISEAGFERMKNDPEYEQWVLEMLRKDFAVPDPWGGRCGERFVIHRFGARKEEYRGESFRIPHNDPGERRRRKKEIEKAYWERKMKRKKRQKELLKKWDEQRRIQKELTEKAELAWENYVAFLKGEKRIFTSVK